MPPRPPRDFLGSHDNLIRRVRNLETGVHPTQAAGPDFVASVDKTAMDWEEGPELAPLTSGNLAWTPWYAKRAGNVMFGGIIRATYVYELPEGGEVYATLPVGVRPVVQLDIVLHSQSETN